MAVEFEITSTMDELATRLAGADARIHAVIDAERQEIADGIRDIVVPAIEAHTPVITGTLRDSTEANAYATPEGAIVEVHQPAENDRGTMYAGFVVEGHRIVAWGHDTGRMQPPNPYPTEALQEVEPAIDEYLQAHAEGMGAHIVTVWR